MVTAQQRREAAELFCERGLSMRRSCALVRVSRNAVEYVSRRPADTAVLAQINQVRKKHPCYGYRRTHAEMTDGEKGVLNHKRVHRIWRENGLQHPVRKKRKRGHATEPPGFCVRATHVT